MAIWQRLKSRYGHDPHPLDELSISLKEGRVTFKFTTAEETIVSQTMKSKIRGGGFAEVTGDVRGEDDIKQHKGACFVLARRSSRIFITPTAQLMTDFRGAQESYRREMERLREKWERTRREAVAKIPGADAEIKVLMESLERQDYSQDAAIRERMFARIEDRLGVLHRAKRELMDARDSEEPPSPDQSYSRPIQLGDFENVSLKQVTDAVNIERRRLLDELGTLPLKPSVIPITNVVYAGVNWK